MRFVALAASVFGWIRAYGAGTFLRTDTEFAAQCAAGVTRFERENPVRAEYRSAVHIGHERVITHVESCFLVTCFGRAITLILFEARPLNADRRMP